VILPKCLDFTIFKRFLEHIFVFNQHKWRDFNTKIFIFAIAAEVSMLCYLLAQYVTVTSL